MTMTKKKSSTPKFAIRNCHFRFRCHMEWDDLKVTERDDIRFCSECSQNVYYCDDRFDLAREIANNRCVAVPVEFIVRYSHEKVSPLLEPNDRQKVRMGFPAPPSKDERTPREIEAAKRRNTLRVMLLKGNFTLAEIKTVIPSKLKVADRLEFIKSAINEMVADGMIGSEGAKVRITMISEMFS